MRDGLITFYQTDLPNAATHCKQEDCGFSIYRGVLIQWDEDHDTRVTEVLDGMPAKLIEELLVVQEHEGSICFLWKTFVPNNYRENAEVWVPSGDIWCIMESRSKI